MSDVDAAPSLTVTVIVLVPVLFVAGLIVSVRFAPDPPSARFVAVFGTSVVFDDDRVTVRLPAAVSASPTVKFTTSVPFFDMHLSEMFVMVGASFTGVTVMFTVTVGEFTEPSFTR